jgi:hypothetical protein
MLCKRIAACFMLGLMITISIAWACALCIDPISTGGLVGSYRTSPGAGFWFWVWSKPGATVVMRLSDYSKDFLEDPAHLVPRWSSISSKASVKEGTVWIEDARGWPLVTMRCERQYDVSRDRLTYSYNTFMTQQLGARELPLMPIWDALVLSASGWGLCAYLALFGPGMLRRRARGRRGACLRCGYDLRYATRRRCPECGDVEKEASAGGSMPNAADMLDAPPIQIS